MKKYFLILLLFVSALAQAQIYSSVPGLKITNEPVQASDTTEVEILSRVISGVNTGKVYVLPYSKLAIPRSTSDLVNDGEEGINAYMSSVDNISDLELYNGSSLVVLVKDSLTGGIFNYWPSGLTVDGGVVFDATGVGSGYWKRWYHGGVIPDWFGAIPNDGVDDTDSFNDACSYYDNIYIPEGKEYITGDVDLISKKVYGGGIIKKILGAESAFHVKGDGTKIEGLTFNAEVDIDQPSTDIKIGEGAKNVIITGNYFESKVYSAVSGSVDSVNGGVPYTTPADGVSIINNTFTKNDSESTGYQRALFLHSIKNIRILGNTIRDTERDAIRLRENDGNCLIDGNHFINIGDNTWPDIQTRDAIDSYWGGETLTISNNIVDTAAHSGFDIKGSKDDDSEKTRRVIIIGNQIKKARFHGIHISGNIDTSAYLYSDSYIVSNNVITECNQDNNTTGHGIYVDGVIRYLNINSNNVSFNKGRGIYILNAYSGTSLVNKAISITNNQVVNNGRSGVATVADAGINIQSIDGVNLTGNICDNDITLPNPYQACGIYINSTTAAFPVSKSGIVKNNICRNNITGQIFIDANTTRANNIVAFQDNIQVGTGAVNRPTWQDQRSIFFGNGIPLSGDGIFNRGDIINNVSPSILGNTGNRYIVSGWKRVSASGSTHVLNTDWVELRTFVDNVEYAPLASPALTGTPTAPTATAGTNTTQIATTAFVTNGLSSKADINSPSFTGTPTAPNPSDADYSTNIATTKFATDVASSYGTQLESEGGATFTIVPSRKKVVLVCTGTTITVDFPPVVGNEGVEIVIINKGSGDATLASDAGDNDFWDAGSSGSGAVVPTNSTATFINDGTHYSKK